jgi:diguanylate cyclase (GGDEF)-like protein
MHQILGTPPSGDLATQFAGLQEGDWDRLVAAVEATLRGEDVDDLELRFSGDAPSAPTPSRACQVSLRPLTDGTHSITGAIGTLSDVTDSVELRRELELRASVDSLTGCLNHGATFELLDHALRAATTAQSGVAAIYIDLDRFKAVNDSYGHAAGDQVLVAVSQKIRSVLRAQDVVGRLGGDEFLVVCPGISSADEGLGVAERIGESLRSRMPVADSHVTLQASVGFAWTVALDESPDALVARADAAMYKSKLDGTGSVVQAPTTDAT